MYLRSAIYLGVCNKAFETRVCTLITCWKGLRCTPYYLLRIYRLMFVAPPYMPCAAITINGPMKGLMPLRKKKKKKSVKTKIAKALLE